MSAIEPAREMVSVTADEVEHYLRENPSFFSDRSALLMEMTLPHASGEVISLVEKQVKALRERHEQTCKRLHELIEIARSNEELSHRMHHLVLTLMDADDPGEIFRALYDDLKRNFRADKVAVRLFAEPAVIEPCAGEEFVGTQASEVRLFRAMMDKRLPVSGRLKYQQQVFLFGDGSDDIASAVLVPLHGSNWSGVMGIGSHDADRFEEGMGVELLTNMGEVLSFILRPWIADS